MKYTYVHQHDERDCAPACLAMVASYFGREDSILYYRKITKTDKNGSNIYGIVDAASHIGLDANALTGTKDELMESISNDEIKFPFIAHIVTEKGFLHFIVVFSVSDGKWAIADPAKGKIELTNEQFFELWTGNIVTFTKTSQFKSGKYKPSTVRLLFGFLKGQLRKMLIIVILSLAVTSIGIIGTFVYQVAIDSIYDPNDSEPAQAGSFAISGLKNNSLGMNEVSISPKFGFSELNTVFILILFIYLLQAVLSILRGRIIMLCSKKIDTDLCVSYFEQTTELPVSDFAVRQTGEYLSRFSDITVIRDAISTATVTMLMDTLMVIVCGIILYLQNARLFVISLIIVILYTVILIYFQKPIENANREVMENNAVIESYLKESFDGMETIKANNANNSIKSKGHTLISTYIDSGFKEGLLTFSQNSLAETVQIIGGLIVLWMGFSMVYSGTLRLGALMTFYALLGYFSEPVKNILMLQPTVQKAFVATERLYDIMGLEKESDGEEIKPFPVADEWALDNISFRYGNQDLILKDISLSVKKGETVAIVGESGSGKSTIAKLLLRFYEPETGMISINGNDIHEYAVADLRKNIAYIDQDTFLFADTIKNNLLLGSPDASDDDIQNACRLSKADSFINDKHLSLDMVLDENGANLSGGQKQRLAIARALLKKPQLLIMDEATSNLDISTEIAIKESISALKNNMACIIIAHRLNIIDNCDKIYVVENGSISGAGTHEELLQNNSYYKNMWESGTQKTAAKQLKTYGA